MFNDINFKAEEHINIGCSPEEGVAVKRAISDLSMDFQKVLDCTVSKTNDLDNCNIIVGTIGVNQLITDMISRGLLNVSPINCEDGLYQWESYIIQEIEGVLYICGADRRGTIYGIYDICRMIGVSPWYYFADVPIRKKSVVKFKRGFFKSDYPSVKYRGIFINDEEELDAWAKEHTDDGTIGPVAYEKIFELLLRLKANYIWPAMHVNYFNENPRNGELAEEMGVIVGTSHCDMLLRSNQNEWYPWLKHNGYDDIKYDYSISGRNRDIIKEYWRKSVELNKNYEVSYTLGMRGIHDSGFITREINNNSELSEDEKVQEKVRLLGQVIQDQRQILKDVLGNELASTSVQTFIPYKEVLDLYDKGLELPEDVTLIWVDDNFGYMRRYPNEKERLRSGGHGLYYHSSYWAHPEMSYLFINSIPLAHTGNELRKSYLSGIRKIWVLNIGAIKPLEQDMEFFLQYAWEAGKEDGITKNAHEFTKTWMNENFTGNHGEKVAELYDIFAQVTNVCKLEHMKSNVFSQAAYGDEAGRRLQKLEYIYQKGNDICCKLPFEEQEAFFQLFLMKIHASYYMNHEYYFADRSMLSYTRGNMQAADQYIELSRKMMDYRRKMLDYYNKRMNDGKWDRILTPESFPPPGIPMYPAGKPAIEIGASGMKVFLWNGECIEKQGTMHFYQHGVQQKWIEIGNQGCGVIDYLIQIIEGDDWLQITEKEGSIRTDKRIFINVNDLVQSAGKIAKLEIINKNDGNNVIIDIQVETIINLPVDFRGTVEADESLIIQAENYNQIYGFESCYWTKVNGIGRYEGNAMMAFNHNLCPLKADPLNVEENPYLEYDFYLSSAGEFVLETERFLTLNSKGRIRFGIAIDNLSPIVLESNIKDEWTGNWKDCVMNNGERISVSLPWLDTGVHKLRLYMIDNFITISRFFIYTGVLMETNLGPINVDNMNMKRKLDCVEYDLPLVDWNDLDNYTDEFYKMDRKNPLLPNVVYAGRDFWSIDRLYAHNEEYTQTSLGKKRYFYNDDGTKNIMKEFGEGLFMEENGIISIETEYSLSNTKDAFLTPDIRNELYWSHLQAETCGRTGLAMHVAVPNLNWETPTEAPGMHFRIQVNQQGVYHVWLLLYFTDPKSDSCYIAVDNKIQKQVSGKNIFTYGTSNIYFWSYMCDIELLEGEHIFSILARKSMLRVDRIYITQGDELPPMDANWVDSSRKV